jgi:hypothetical protein
MPNDRTSNICDFTGPDQFDLVRLLRVKKEKRMLTPEQEIELLLSILPTIDDEYQYASIARRAIELNFLSKNERSEYDPKDQQSKHLNGRIELNGS